MIAIIHPDLGIGGAERLIVDVAHSLLKAGKEIQLYTTHHNKRHCFPETLEEGDRARWIHVRSTWLPTAIFGYLHVVCVNIRCAWATVSYHNCQHSSMKVSALALYALGSRAFGNGYD
jgi:hypothetical protein